MEKARKLSQELSTFSFAVPSFQSDLSLIMISNYSCFKSALILLFLLWPTDPKFFILSPVKMKGKLVWPKGFTIHCLKLPCKLDYMFNFLHTIVLHTCIFSSIFNCFLKHILSPPNKLKILIFWLELIGESSIMEK